MPSLTTNAKAKRDQQICERRAKGDSFVVIGSEFGLSRETVRGIWLREVSRQKKFNKLAPLRAAFARGV